LAGIKTPLTEKVETPSPDSTFQTSSRGRGHKTSKTSVKRVSCLWSLLGSY